jgi:hypothetical protein
MKKWVDHDIEFENWFLATLLSERRRWYQEGLEDGKNGRVNQT